MLMDSSTDMDRSAPETGATDPFARVPEALQPALRDRGFDKLTAVQEKALEVREDARDLRISSQTGSGKTLALGFAMADDLIGFVDGSAPRALVIAPTRELATQVQTELNWLYAGVRGVKVDVFTGGTHVGQERRRLARNPAIVVGTPGRLLDHIRSGALVCDGITQLVLDEADQMLDMGFRDDLEAILDAMPEERRTHLVSATFPRGVQRLADTYQNDPVHVEGTALGAANEDIAHVAHLVNAKDRYNTLVNLLLLADGQRVLVFVATRMDCARVAERLAKDGFAAMALSGELAQAQRTRTLEAFRSGAIQALVATDVAARGLDIPDVSIVVHGDLPMDGEVYTHRSGRTGRAGNKGRSILLATPAGERRARRIHADAKVEADWQPLARVEEVRKALHKRGRRRIRAMIVEPAETPNESQLEFATSLLDSRDPAEVVAALIQGVQSTHPCEPRDVTPVAPRGSRRDSRDTRDTRDGGARDERRSGGAPAAPRDHDSSNYTRYRINWGFRHGANPRRLLAVICRRGDVSSQNIGAIRVEAYATSFEVKRDVVRDFEANAFRTDKRHPQHRIERDHGFTRERHGRRARRERD